MAALSSERNFRTEGKFCATGLLRVERLVSQVVMALGESLIHVLLTAEWTGFETGATAHKVFNLVEGVIWIAIGIALIWKSRSLERARSPAILAGVTFILFAVSDFIEIRTGSWYQPAWLLLWNVTCVASLVSSLIWYLAVRRKQD